MNRTANTTISQSGTRRFDDTSMAEYAVAIARSTIVVQRAGIVGTVISGSWIRSDCVDRRKVVSPSCGAKTASARARRVKIANAIGAFQLVTTVVSRVTISGEGAGCCTVALT